MGTLVLTSVSDSQLFQALRDLGRATSWELRAELERRFPPGPDAIISRVAVEDQLHALVRVGDARREHVQPGEIRYSARRSMLSEHAAQLDSVYRSFGVEPILEHLREPLGGYAHTRELVDDAVLVVDKLVTLYGRDAVLAHLGEG